MTLLTLIHRSLRQHALSTLVSAGGLALAAGLLLTVWVVKEQAQAAFANTTSGFDAVLGARGSKLQLVLNAVFHLEASPGNLPPQDVEAVRRHPAVKAAIPIAVGDNYRGWRIVGTLPSYFEVEYAAGRRYALAPGGRMFADRQREAVVGALAARRLGWKVGDTFRPYHGLAFDPATQHEEVYTITGILEPTGTPADRVVWIPLSGVQTMGGHDPRAANDVSAVLVQLRAASAGVMLDTMINRQGNRMTFAYPIGTIVADLFNKIGWVDRVLTLVAWLVAAVAAALVLVGIHGSMSARRRDLAILRALGAHRRTVFGAVLGEAAAIGVLGAALGFVVFLGLGTGVAAMVRAETGVVLEPFRWDPVLVWVPAALVALATLGGLAPAWQAYRVPVAETIAPVS